MKDEYYCSACLQNKQAREFTVWINDKSKARRCNSCNNSEVVKRRMQKSEKERKSKPDAPSPILKELSAKLSSKSKCEIRDRIADYRENKRINDEIGD